MFRLKWKKKAKRQLAELWLAAHDRNEVTDTVAVIDKKLASRPMYFGESRASSVSRVMYQQPLYVEYDVVMDDMKVIVTAVGWA
jgi:hypothetical protein